MRRLLVTMTLAALAGVQAGCYDEPGVTVYEPGVYKGDHDPLLEKMDDKAHRETLRERFRIVQMDR